MVYAPRASRWSFCSLLSCGWLEAARRAVEVAREVLRERGYTDEEINALLNRRPGRDFAEF
jgi:hypothetical protein